MSLLKAGGGDDRNVERHRVRSESTPSDRTRSISASIASRSNEGRGMAVTRPCAAGVKDPTRTSFLDGTAPPSVICRSSQAKERIELQADLHASYLLMPRKLVFSAWNDLFPDRKQRVLKPCTPFSHPFVETPRISRHFGERLRRLRQRAARIWGAGHAKRA